MSHANLSRRAMLAAVASAPVVTLPALANVTPDPDAKLVELGSRLERLVREDYELTLQWAPRMRAAHAETEKKFGAGWARNRVASRLFQKILDRNGVHALDDQMSAVGVAAEEIAEAIMESDAITLGGLRAKAVAMLYGLRPGMAGHEGELNFPDDGGGSRSLFLAVAAMTGLAPLVREMEGRLRADAGLNEEQA
jgi:hypothetical protein